eukprot:COSAG05_NODE_4681_length_1413_cov_1.250381_1_plen_74_part_00
MGRRYAFLSVLQTVVQTRPALGESVQMLPLVAPLVLLALSSAVPTMGRKLSQRKGKNKNKKHHWKIRLRMSSY